MTNDTWKQVIKRSDLDPDNWSCVLNSWQRVTLK